MRIYPTFVIFFGEPGFDFMAMRDKGFKEKHILRYIHYYKQQPCVIVMTKTALN